MVLSSLSNSLYFSNTTVVTTTTPRLADLKNQKYEAFTTILSAPRDFKTFTKALSLFNYFHLRMTNGMSVPNTDIKCILQEAWIYIKTQICQIKILGEQLFTSNKNKKQLKINLSAFQMFMNITKMVWVIRNVHNVYNHKNQHHSIVPSFLTYKWSTWETTDKKKCSTGRRQTEY